MSDRAALAVVLFTAACTLALLYAGYEACRRLAGLLHDVMTAIASPESVRVMRTDDGEEG